MTTFIQTQPLIERPDCFRHAGVKTGLRCNKCDNPICHDCAIRTVVGYKCPRCVRAIQNNFFNGQWWDYGLAVLIALPLSLLAAFVFTFLISGFSWLIALLVAPTVSGFIAEAVRQRIQKRRSRYLAHVVAACLIVAIVPFLLLPGLVGGLFGMFIPGLYGYGVIEPGLLLFIGVGTIMARLR